MSKAKQSGDVRPFLHAEYEKYVKRNPAKPKSYEEWLRERMEVMSQVRDALGMDSQEKEEEQQKASDMTILPTNSEDRKFLDDYDVTMNPPAQQPGGEDSISGELPDDPKYEMPTPPPGQSKDKKKNDKPEEKYIKPWMYVVAAVVVGLFLVRYFLNK